MASIKLDFTLDTSKEGIKFWLSSKGHKHLKSNRDNTNDFNLHVGDAIRCKEGLIARIVHKKDNTIIIANNKMSKDAMNTYFNREVITQSKGCPYCGNPEGSELDCPDGCFNN